eukprot:TRINITY_DN4539_c0_g1_i2.p1 TRINITY_DN4539_c0_g1~~TRINITY_DN4539_c0_g1_i2.p1  ORF type:complete len:335 (-),score=65.09 TRINITY_DN4539_c0_g1_i2:100-1083(-)
MSSKNVAVIGAGPSGLVTTRWMKTEGHKVKTYEASSDVGGLWRYTDDPKAHSSAYTNLKTNTTKHDTQFSEFPMPKEFPNNPHNTQVLSYLEKFTDHFHLRDNIQFNTKVVQVSPVSKNTKDGEEGEEDGWIVVVEKEGKKESHHFDAVAVCNGRTWNPVHIPVEGQESFEGEQIHSHNYRKPTIADGKRVLIRGVGISGYDILSDICLHSSAKELIICTRRNKLIMKGTQSLVPGGPPITMKPRLIRLSGLSATFEDETESEVDLIIHCTGYKYGFPFLDEGVVEIEENPSRVALYQHVFSLCFLFSVIIFFVLFCLFLFCSNNLI